MSIGETLSRLLLKRLVDDVFVTGGVEALDAVVDFLLRCGQQDEPFLTAALKRAMQRAWSALEAALSGEPGWDHSQTGLTPRAAQALRRCLARVLAELAHGKGVSDRRTVQIVAHALRRQCLEDLYCACAAETLADCIDQEEWVRSQETFVRFAAYQEQRDMRRRTEGQLLRDLEQYGYVGLMRLLTGAGGLPLLLTAARAFLCQELTQLLYYCLQESPEQTPDNCTLVLEILHELSHPCFTLWRTPALCEQARGRAHSLCAWHSGHANCLPDVGRPAARTPHAPWTLAAALTIAAALVVAAPTWLLVENSRYYERERQRVATGRQHLRNEQRRIEEEHQRLIEMQRQSAREEQARQQALQRQWEEAKRRRLAEAEEEQRRAEEQAAQWRTEQQRRSAEGRQACLREEQRRREQARTTLEDGLTHSALRQDQAALAALSEALRLDPNLQGAWSARGVVRRRLGDQTGALEDFYEATRRDPQDVHSWFQCGELHAERREHRQAIDAFTAVLCLEPNDWEAYRQRGLCYGHCGEVDKAIADQTKAIELAPDDPQAYCHRADLYRLRDDLDRAFTDYTAAIDRTKDRSLAGGAYRGRGMIALHWQKYNQAIQDLTRALEYDPADSTAQRARCLAYLRNGEWTNALLDAEELIQHNTDDHVAYKLRGQAYMGLKDYRRAHEDFSRALRKGRDAETFYLRARAKVHLGDIQEAIFDCNDATAINPHLAGAFYLRGTLNLREGYRISGLADCRIAHELDPQFPLP